jgi:hypothetical protein
MGPAQSVVMYINVEGNNFKINSKSDHARGPVGVRVGGGIQLGLIICNTTING